MGKSTNLYVVAGMMALLAGIAHAQEPATAELKYELQKGIAERLGENSGVSVTYLSASSVTEDIQRAVGSIVETTDYIADNLCKKRSRPTKITLHLTAGFNLVFEAQTGSEVEWELETVCARYPEPTE